jgi:hypothetical protein
MVAFVSYAKADVSDDVMDRRQRLGALEGLIRRHLGPVFIDEIHNGDRDQATVVAALERATVFCVIQGDRYWTRPWPRWEYDHAVAHRLPIYEVVLAKFQLQRHSQSPARYPSMTQLWSPDGALRMRDGRSLPP